MPTETQEGKVNISLDDVFWNDRYKNNEIGWDIGYCSTPIKDYFDQLSDKDISILIPGCGNAYEAEYIWSKGFKKVYLVDLSITALESFQKRVPEFPAENLMQKDFFKLSGQFDLIIEQTFFCAIHPKLRKDYAIKTAELLSTKGKLVGLLFNDRLNLEHPPFGGDSEEYKKLFSPYFNIDIMEKAFNSIEPRSGRELFVKFTKK